MFILLSIFIILTILIWFRLSIKIQNLAYALLYLLMLALVIFRGNNFDRDYGSYLDLYQKIDSLSIIDIEPTFILISSASYSFISIIAIYGILSLSIKFKTICSNSVNVAASLYIYFSYTYALHDLTQIRTGLAGAILLYSIPDLLDGKKIKFICKILVAGLFHYSFFILVCLILIRKKINKSFYLLIIPAAYLIRFYWPDLLGMNIVENNPIEILNRMRNYSNDFGGQLNLFNGILILRIFTAYLLILIVNKFNHEKYNILVKIYFISIISYILLSINPALSNRISDIFIIVDIFTLPLLFLVMKRIYANLYIYSYGLCYIYINIFYNSILNLS